MGDLESDKAWAALAWQVELGADEAILDQPVDRFALKTSDATPKTAGASNAKPPTPALPAAADPIQAAKSMAEAANDLSGLRAALGAFDHCELRHGARNLVFSDGNPEAQVMIIGEAPGRDEDMQGKPFVGRAGQLLDRMLAAIGMNRGSEHASQSVYITNILPWRPPQNRDPKPAEIAMMMPFIERHVALADPDVLVLTGNISCQGVLGRRGITKLRGHWAQAFDRPVLPMFHPAYLLRNPAAKREAWQDLLSLKAKL